MRRCRTPVERFGGIRSGLLSLRIRYQTVDVARVDLAAWVGSRGSWLAPPEGVQDDVCPHRRGSCLHVTCNTPGFRVVCWYYCVIKMLGRCGLAGSRRKSGRVSGCGAGKTGRAESVYQAVYEPIRERRPISAMYNELPSLLCPHRLGRNSKGQLRVLCYQFGGWSETGLGPPLSSE